jgi:hypothetical protein
MRSGRLGTINWADRLAILGRMSRSNTSTPLGPGLLRARFGVTLAASVCNVAQILIGRAQDMGPCLGPGRASGPGGAGLFVWVCGEGYPPNRWGGGSETSEKVLES